MYILCILSLLFLDLLKMKLLLILQTLRIFHHFLHLVLRVETMLIICLPDHSGYLAPILGHSSPASSKWYHLLSSGCRSCDSCLGLPRWCSHEACSLGELGELHVRLCCLFLSVLSEDLLAEGELPHDIRFGDHATGSRLWGFLSRNRRAYALRELASLLGKGVIVARIFHRYLLLVYLVEEFILLHILPC